jgi:DNA ligase (NAD+)
MDLILVDEIGEKIAKVSLSFDNEENKIIIDRLKNYGIQFEIIESINPNATDKLVGKFCVSVFFNSSLEMN